MRPKKNVLLYCAADEGSQVAFVLGVRIGWVNVTAVSTPRAFLEASIADDAEFECIVVVRSKNHDLEDSQVLAALYGEDTGALTIEVMNALPEVSNSCAQKRVYGPIRVSISEIIEKVKLTCTRKRGPKTAPQQYGFRLMIGKAA